MTALVDLDGNRDGVSDLYARDADGRLWLYSGDGAGGLGARASRSGSGWSTMTAPGLTRRRQPGRRRRTCSPATAPAVLWLYPGNGIGGFLPRVKVGGGWGGLTHRRPR